MQGLWKALPSLLESVLIKGIPENSLSPFSSYDRIQKEAGSLQLERNPYQNAIILHTDLRVLDSRTMRNTFLLFIGVIVSVLCYSSQNYDTLHKVP